MSERIRELRKSLGLTQEQFAGQIGIKRNTIANYETGRNTPVDSVISLICKVFNVSEQWLRYGKGEKFLKLPDNEIDALAKRYRLSPKDKALIKTFVEMNGSARDVFSHFFESAAAALAEIKD